VEMLKHIPSAPAFLGLLVCEPSFYGAGVLEGLDQCKRIEDVQSGIVPPRNAQVALVGERLQLGRTLERELYLALLVRSEREIAKGFRAAAMSSSSSLQQVQSLCARSNPFLDHKGSISSTSTWRRGSSTRRSLLLRVCVHPQYHCTHQQTFAGCCTSSQSAPDTNRDDIQRSRQM